MRWRDRLTVTLGSKQCFKDTIICRGLRLKEVEAAPCLLSLKSLNKAIEVWKIHLYSVGGWECWVLPYRAVGWKRTVMIVCYGVVIISIKRSESKVRGQGRRRGRRARNNSSLVACCLLCVVTLMETNRQGRIVLWRTWIILGRILVFWINLVWKKGIILGLGSL